MFAFAAGAFSVQAFSPAAFAIESVIAVSPAPTYGGGAARRRAPPEVLRGAMVAASGRSVVDVVAVRELVLAATAGGATTSTARADLEVVRAVEAHGATLAGVRLRGEKVPVFSDTELLALGVWASKYRH